MNPTLRDPPPALGRDAVKRVLARTADALSAQLVLLGVVLGFALCCMAGRIAAGRPMFNSFTRFFPPIEPSYYFYPTISELDSWVRATVPRSQHLVIVGGASYFRGSGQNPDTLWTKALQQKLGPGYSVVNFAMDGANTTSAAGVCFQVLAAEYPRITYVANASPIVVDPIDSGAAFTFSYWDAYYKGLLPIDAQRRREARLLRHDEMKDEGGLALHLGKAIDAVTYSADLWTYVGYKWIFTVWSNGVAGTFLTPRGRYVDEPDDGLRAKQLAFRDNKPYIANYESFNRSFVTKGFVEDAGVWKVDAPAWQLISDLSARDFPAGLRPDCLLVFVRPNPFYMRGFTADDWKRHDQMYALGEEAFVRQGYRVVQLPDSLFQLDDYYDAGHFMASGGDKIAEAVARAIRKP